MTTPPPRLDGILETALYVSDLSASKAFYTMVLGADVMLDTPRLVALAVGGRSVLLLFQRGATAEATQTPGGVVPGHGAEGIQHVAFAIAAETLDGWKERLAAAGIAIESVVTWERGGRSVYLRDPDGHSVELVTPGLWTIY